MTTTTFKQTNRIPAGFILFCFLPAPIIGAFGDVPGTRAAAMSPSTRAVGRREFASFDVFDISVSLRVITAVLCALPRHYGSLLLIIVTITIIITTALSSIELFTYVRD